MTDEQLGRVAYEEYVNQNARGNEKEWLFPKWQELSRAAHNAWVKVAQAVVNETPPF